MAEVAITIGTLDDAKMGKFCCCINILAADNDVGVVD